jgi:hypothetical protein
MHAVGGPGSIRMYPVEGAAPRRGLRPVARAPSLLGRHTTSVQLLPSSPFPTDMEHATFMIPVTPSPG